MKKYLVIGDPIKHSLSPKLHNHWIKENKINAIYDKKLINESDIGEIINEIKKDKISGINGNNTGYTEKSGSYGLFLPDISTILLNGEALDLNNAQGINLDSSGTNRTINSDQNNPQKLFLAMSGSGASSFGLASQETITSDYIFVRARSSEFNYSENPSFISGSTGEVIYSYFINNPNVFPTTVGLYNDNNDLLAVAKLSKPILKDFTKEALIRVKLDF